jgi:predicted site-specific integrase-resolvase
VAPRRITTRDAEALYGIPARTIRRWYTEGRLTDPVIDKGRYLWMQTEIDQMHQLRGASRLRRPRSMTHS